MLLGRDIGRDIADHRWFRSSRPRLEMDDIRRLQDEGGTRERPRVRENDDVSGFMLGCG